MVSAFLAPGDTIVEQASGKIPTQCRWMLVAGRSVANLVIYSGLDEPPKLPRCQ